MKITDWCCVRDWEVLDMKRKGFVWYREYYDSYRTLWVELVKYAP